MIRIIPLLLLITILASACGTIQDRSYIEYCHEEYFDGNHPRLSEPIEKYYRRFSIEGLQTEYGYFGETAFRSGSRSFIDSTGYEHSYAYEEYYVIAPERMGEVDYFYYDSLNRLIRTETWLFKDNKPSNKSYTIEHSYADSTYIIYSYSRDGRSPGKHVEVLKHPFVFHSNYFYFGYHNDYSGYYQDSIQFDSLSRLIKFGNLMPNIDTVILMTYVQYNSMGKRASEVSIMYRGNEREDESITTYYYDRKSRLRSKVHTYNWDEKVIIQDHYKFYPRGPVKTIKHYSNGKLRSITRYRYTYY